MDKEYSVLDNFFVLEGLDGSGTTTQLKRINEKLKEFSIPHFTTVEPTENNIGRLIRSLLKGEQKVNPKTMAYLFAADRNEHLYAQSDGILAHLNLKELVICDRYLFSSLAYQSNECGFDFVQSLNRYFPLPGHLIYIDVPVDVCRERLKERKDIEIYENTDFQKKVGKCYQKTLEYYKDSPMQIHRIDGKMNSDEVFKKIWSIFLTLPIF